MDGNNRRWKKFPDEKPSPIKKEYITCDTQGNVGISLWEKASNTDFKWWDKITVYPIYPIIAYMEKPPPPDF